MTQQLQVISDCRIGSDTKIYNFVNLYKCQIGNNCIIGSFVEIQKDVLIGDRVKVSSHTFLCTGVVVEEDVFIGHHVVFTNDRYPEAVRDGVLAVEGDWLVEKTVVRKGASIGSNVTVLPGVTIGRYALIGAGSVVTRDVPEYAVAAGNPAKVLRIKHDKTS